MANMGKRRPHSNKPSASTSSAKTTNVALMSRTQTTLTTTSAVAADPILGYKIRVLLHDFLTVTKDPNAARRIGSTTNEHYISAPYFDDFQAAVVKAALVDVDLDEHNLAPIATRYAQADADIEEDVLLDTTSLEGQTFETAVQALLSTFFDKRRASGDARPCGPHHLAPLYAGLFGIGIEELDDEKFLGRLRRNGLKADKSRLSESMSLQQT
ncbi:hypothetical protein HJFPF1_02848 [Paramyrothecium foliicola]|nr:hypothetical protein HJFPF1_02848 [Paramyrothecium foliicola]